MLHGIPIITTYFFSNIDFLNLNSMHKLTCIHSYCIVHIWLSLYLSMPQKPVLTHLYSNCIFMQITVFLVELRHFCLNSFLLASFWFANYPYLKLVCYPFCHHQNLYLHCHVQHNSSTTLSKLIL